MKKNKSIPVSVILIFFTMFTSCSSNNKKNDPVVKNVLSSFKGEPVVPREANKIHITEFHNLTTQTAISEKLTLKIKEQINLDGRLAVVTESEQADLEVKGILTDYQVQPVKFNGFDKPERKRLRIIASIKLNDLKRNREIFFERGIQAFEEFSEIIPPIASEIQIRDKVLDDLAKRISLQIINGWYTKLMTPVEKGKK